MYAYSDTYQGSISAGVDLLPILEAQLGSKIIIKRFTLQTNSDVVLTLGDKRRLGTHPQGGNNYMLNSDDFVGAVAVLASKLVFDTSCEILRFNFCYSIR